jgi:hypothetical protein
MAGAAMLEPIVAGGRWMKERLPFPFRLGLPHFNFIGVHYIYMIGFIIATSIMLYPAGLRHSLA